MLIDANLYVKCHIESLTVSTPANITSTAWPLTSSGVSSPFVSKYVSNETTIENIKEGNFLVITY